MEPEEIVVNLNLDVRQVVDVAGILLTREIDGITGVPKSLFPDDIAFIEKTTIFNDVAGTVGVYVGELDSARISVRTITIAPHGDNEPVLLGNVATKAALPTTVFAAEDIWQRTPRIGDYANVLADETNGGKRAEWYIMAISDNSITWGNPVVLNTGDFQAQTTASDSGKLLIGGATAGTFGTSRDIVTSIGNNNNIPTAAAVNTALNNKFDKINMSLSGTTLTITL